MKPLRLSAFAVALVLAGCTASPTDAPLRDHAAPSFDEGGTMLGSGNDGSEVMGSGGDGVTGDSAPPAAPTAPSDTTGGTSRGGNMLGSGN